MKVEYDVAKDSDVVADKDVFGINNIHIGLNINIFTCCA